MIKIVKLRQISHRTRLEQDRIRFGIHSDSEYTESKHCEWYVLNRKVFSAHSLKRNTKRITAWWIIPAHGSISNTGCSLWVCSLTLCCHSGDLVRPRQAPLLLTRFVTHPWHTWLFPLQRSGLIPVKCLINSSWLCVLSTELYCGIFWHTISFIYLFLSLQL